MFHAKKEKLKIKTKIIIIIKTHKTDRGVKNQIMMVERMQEMQPF